MDWPSLAAQVTGGVGEVASRVLCKSSEGFLGPVLVHTLKDAVEDSFAAAAGGEGAHNTDAASHFDEEPLDHISGAQLLPVGERALKDGQ